MNVQKRRELIEAHGQTLIAVAILNLHRERAWPNISGPTNEEDRMGKEHEVVRHMDEQGESREVETDEDAEAPDEGEQGADEGDPAED